MINQELLSYVKGELGKGAAKEQVKGVLMANGWDAQDVEEAFAAVLPLPVASTPPHTIPATPATPITTAMPVTPAQPVAQVQPHAAVKPTISVSVEQPMTVQPTPQFTSATVSPAVQPASAPQEFSKKTSHTKALVVALIVGVFALGGAAFAYKSGYISLPLFEKQTPESVVEKTIANIAGVTSLEYSGEIKFETEHPDFGGDPAGPADGKTLPLLPPKKDSFLITFTGKSDVENVAAPKSEFTFNITTNAFGEEDFSFAIEARVIEQTLYVRLSDVPNIGIFDLSLIKNQWVKTDIKYTSEQLGLGDLGEKIKKQEELSASPEQIAKLKVAFQKTKLITITSAEANEELDGKAMYHYNFVLNKEGIKNFVSEVAIILGEEAPTAEELAGLDKSFESIDIQNGQIWIGTKDLLPHKVYFESVATKGSSTDANKGVFTLSFANYNQPVEVAAPADAKSIEQVMSEIFGASVEPEAAKAKPATPAKAPVKKK